MADHAPVLLWMTGTDAECNFFNERWMRFTGRDMQEEIGVGWAEGVHPEDFQRCMHTFLDAFVARRDFAMEYRLRNRHGEYRWIYDQGTPRYGASGEFLGYIGSCIDVTDIRRAREKLKDLNKELERRVRERTQEVETALRELEAFSYSVSHDLRAPLRVINGFARTLIEEYGSTLDTNGMHMLEKICNAAQNMGQLVDALLELSRFSRAELTSGPVDLTRLAREVVEELRLRDPSRTVNVRIQENLHASGDERLLRVVLDNLLGNAWKFTGATPDPQISFTAETRNDCTIFCVRDNGAGFDMKQAGKLFLPFHRLHSGTTYSGTGIGLATAKRIIERHAGKIWAHSEPTRGAAFYFTLSA